MTVSIEELERISIYAGRLIERLKAEGRGFSRKDDGSPVTEADQYAEELILERLAKAYPDIPVVAEELASEGNTPKVAVPRFFLVDPLDGTKEFIRGSGDYTVNIALIENRAPIAGVVAAPARNVLYSGAGTAAARVGIDVEGRRSDRRAIRVLSRNDCWVAVVSASHMTPATDALLKQLPIARSVSIGSSLKFCLVAEGEADVYPRLGRTMQWDTAAGDAVLRAAGGSTLTLDGAPLLYGPRGSDGLDYANPHFVCFGGVPARLAELSGAA